MSRGLGRLQVAILRLALNSGGTVPVRGILEALWGWRAKSWKEKYDGGQVFDRASIGAEEYGRVHATLSRTLERLRQRGLIRIFKDATGCGTMIALTSYGEEAVQGIVKEEESS